MICYFENFGNKLSINEILNKTNDIVNINIIKQCI